MDKFNQIITELWPLIEVQNCVLLNIIFHGRVSCLPAALLFSVILDRILFILTGNDKIHKSLDEFEIRPDPTTDERFSCP